MKISPDADSPRVLLAARKQCGVWIASVLVGLAGIWAPPLFAQNKAITPLPEYQVKAAFLYHFTLYVEWPEKMLAAMGSTFNICVIGDDPFGESLDHTFEGRSVQGKSFVVRRINKAEEARSCAVLFVATAKTSDVPSILDQVASYSVLTVSDRDSFAQNGGVIGLIIEEERVKFEINQDAAERSGLRVSAKLLQLARVVYGKRSENP